jgi:hypothetical protein
MQDHAHGYDVSFREGILEEVNVSYLQTCTVTTAQHSTAQHSTAQHSTAQHSTAQRSAAQGRAVFK